MKGLTFDWSLSLFCILAAFLGKHRATSKGEQKEYVDVRRISDDVRIKRADASDFPLKLGFRLETGTGNITLDLERSVSPRKVTPVYTIEVDGIHFRKNSEQGTFGVYQDIGLGASVLVKRSPEFPDSFELFGSFTYNKEHYQLEPDLSFHRKRRSSNEETSSSAPLDTVRHRLKRQINPYGDFLGDELMAPPDSAGLNRVYDIPPYPAVAAQPNSEEVPLIQLQMSKPVDHIFDTTTNTYESDVLLRHSRRRRQTSETMYIEYMVVVDYKNLERWKEKLGGATEAERESNAFDAMHEYYQFVVNGIDVRFRTATGDGPEIRVVFATLLVSTEENTSPWIQNNMLSPTTVDDAGVLLDFATWKHSVYGFLPSHDHAGLFTGFDIATPTSLTPIGMGYLNSICNEAWGVSEIEETYNAVTIHIAAHELGHNIGTRHDGNGNSCASSSMYLMAPRLPFVYNAEMRTNPWTFSSCSQTAIKTFISGLGSQNCLNNAPARSGLDAEMPGLQYSADQQCNMTYGNNAVVCRDNLYYQWETICYAMQCKQKGQNSCEGRFFPFDGTPCGDKKWCQSGKCVSSDDAPSSSESCLFGDDPNVDCTVSNACDESNLYSSKVRCCATCSRTTSTSTPSTTTTTVSTSTSSTSTTTASTSTSTPSYTTTTASTSSSTPSTATTTSSTSTSTPSTTTTTASTSTSTPSTTTTTSSTSTSTPSTTTTTSSTSTSTPSTTTTTSSTSTSTPSTTTPTSSTSISTPSTTTTTASTSSSTHSAATTTTTSSTTFTSTLPSVTTTSTTTKSLTTTPATSTATETTTSSSTSSSELPSSTSSLTTTSTTTMFSTQTTTAKTSTSTQTTPSSLTSSSSSTSVTTNMPSTPTTSSVTTSTSAQTTTKTTPTASSTTTNEPIISTTQSTTVTTETSTTSSTTSSSSPETTSSTSVSTQTSSLSPASTSSTTSSTSSPTVMTSSTTSPTSTSSQTSVSTMSTISRSTSTVSSTMSTTPGPTEELTFELQSMISLFIASALIV